MNRQAFNPGDQVETIEEVAITVLSPHGSWSHDWINQGRRGTVVEVRPPYNAVVEFDGSGASGSCAAIIGINRLRKVDPRRW